MNKTIATGILGAALLFAGVAPAIASADPTDTGIGTSPGLQQNCAFNSAFAKMHAKACDGIGVDQVASNGGPKPYVVAPVSAAPPV